MAAANGLRRVPRLGNANAGTSASFNYVLGKPYYWSVQAVDTAWAGSAFAADASFKFVVAPAPVNGTNAVPGDVNGDGIVSQAELDQVLANYWPYSPFLYMTKRRRTREHQYHIRSQQFHSGNFYGRIFDESIELVCAGTCDPQISHRRY